MADFISDIKSLYDKFKLANPGNVSGFLTDDYSKMRIEFMLEELSEFSEAVGFNKLICQKLPTVSNGEAADLESSLDALVDLMVVLLGTAYCMGFLNDVPTSSSGPTEKTIFEEAWRRVQNANLSKVRVKSASESKRGSGFDLKKPEGWEAPKFKDLIGGSNE